MQEQGKNPPDLTNDLKKNLEYDRKDDPKSQIQKRENTRNV